jgi:hypothetical protein
VSGGTGGGDDSGGGVGADDESLFLGNSINKSNV